MKLSFWETWFIRFALCFLTGNPINVLMYGESGGQEVDVNAQGNFLEPGINMLIYSISFLALCVRWKHVLLQIKRGTALVLPLVFLVVISTFWSESSDITSRRTFLVFGATIFGLYFATCFSFKQQLQFLCWSFSASTLINLAFGILVPHYGVMRLEPHAGSWRGIYMHKQSLGIQMAMNAGFFLTMLNGKTFQKSKGKMLLGVVGSILLIILSRSSTGLALLGLTIMALALGNLLLLRFDFRIISAIFCCSIVLLGGILSFASMNAEQMANWFGKDLTISGRDQLWAVVWEIIGRRPWLGYGYESFWVTGYREVWQLVGWSPPHAHNGFLELLLSLGWVGTLIWLLTLIINFFRSFQLIHVNTNVEALWTLIYLLYVIVANMTEKNFLGGGIIWILYIWICFLPIASIKSTAPSLSLKSSKRVIY